MKLIAFALVVMTAFTCFGQSDSGADSVKVYFRVGQSRYDPAFGNNRQSMDRFMDVVANAFRENDVESIVVRAYTSPDGTSKVNERLAKERCDVVANYVVDHLKINPSLIKKMPEGIAWEDLRDMVATTPGVPSRDAVLDILDNTPVWVFDRNGKIIDGRKARLMLLNGGAPYRWMLKHLFPELRNAVVVSIIIKEHSPVEEPVESSGEEELSGNSQKTEVLPEPELKEVAVEETEEVAMEETEEVAMEETEEIPAEKSVDTEESVNFLKGRKDSRFALKTNLLDYAILMPNIEVEWMFADRWSAALEWQGAWYAKESAPRKVYRLSTVIPEVRYWVIDRSRWHGMYVGVFAGGGRYDLSNNEKGHEGEGGLVGVSAGYMWPISKHLSLDAGLGLGYLRVRDKEYVPSHGHFLYKQTKYINYFGPLRLKLSLVWRIPR